MAASALKGQRYSVVAIALHWAIAALLLANLAVGWRMTFLDAMAQYTMFQLHKSIGITVLILSLLRLAWRLTHRPPPLSADMQGWERLAAEATHWVLYGVMIGLPLTGWIVVSVSPYNLPTLVWDVVPWPHIGPLHALGTAQRALVETVAGGAHWLLAWGTAGLVILHVGAALRHHIALRDDTLVRMIPFLPSRPERR